MKRFTESHEWVELSQEIARVGITNYAQKELGAIVYVELPKLQCKVKTGDEIVVLESTKAAVDIYSPLEGKIIEVNTALIESPELVNTSAENEGWLYKLQVANIQEFEKLLDEKTYRRLIQSTM